MEITTCVVKALRASGIDADWVTLFIRHASASLVIQENADPDVRGEIVVQIVGE